MSTSDKKIDQSRYNVLTCHLGFASSGDPRKYPPELALSQILAEIQFLFDRQRDDPVSVMLRCDLFILNRSQSHYETFVCVVRRQDRV